jgi:hypothetical protein
MRVMRMPSEHALTDTLMGEDTAKLRVEHAEAIERRRQLQQRRTAAETGKLAAQRADDDAFARARRAGEADPGQKHVEANAAEQAEVARLLRGEAQTLHSIESDIEAMRRTRRDAWLASLDQQRAAALTFARESFATTVAAIRDVERLDQDRAWVIRGLPSIPQRATDLSKGIPNGATFTLDTLIGEVSRTLGEWEHKPVAVAIDDDGDE